jgi:hypothetical protein
MQIRSISKAAWVNYNMESEDWESASAIQMDNHSSFHSDIATGDAGPNITRYFCYFSRGPRLKCKFYVRISPMIKISWTRQTTSACNIWAKSL